MKGTLPAPATVLLKLYLAFYFPAVLAAVIIPPFADGALEGYEIVGILCFGHVPILLCVFESADEKTHPQNQASRR